MVEMTVGSRFFYDGKLCEVVADFNFACDRCVFNADRYTCENTECRAPKRHDGNAVYFKEVKE